MALLKDIKGNFLTDPFGRVLSTEIIKWDKDFQKVILFAVRNEIALPNQDVLKKINDKIVLYKENDIWQKFDYYFNFGLADLGFEEFKSICYKRVILGVPNGGLEDTLYGFKGNAIDAYFETNYNLNTSPVNYTLNNAGIGNLLYEEQVSGAHFFGQSSGHATRVFNSNNSLHRINRSENLSANLNFAGSGLMVLNRETSTIISAINKDVYTQLTGQLAANDLGGNVTFRLFQRVNVAFSDVGISTAFAGASITESESQIIRTIENDYLISIGLNPVA